MQPCPTNIVIHKVKVCLCNDHIFLKKTNQLNHIIHRQIVVPILQASDCKAALGSFIICQCCHRLPKNICEPSNLGLHAYHCCSLVDFW